MLVLLGIGTLVVAYAMLYPGLTEPMLSLVGTVEKTKLVEIGREMLRDSVSTNGLIRGLAERVIDGLQVSGTIEAFDKTNSILGTARELWAGGNVLVAVLILSFSVLVPTLKACLLLSTLMPFGAGTRRRLTAIANASGKWSMADVFVIAIFIAFLGGKGMSGSSGLVDFTATLESGFWWFLGYCLLSTVGTQLIAAGRPVQHLAGPDGNRSGFSRSGSPLGGAPRALPAGMARGTAEKAASRSAPQRSAGNSGGATRAVVKRTTSAVAKRATSAAPTRATGTAAKRKTSAATKRATGAAAKRTPSTSTKKKATAATATRSAVRRATATRRPTETGR